MIISTREAEKSDVDALIALRSILLDNGNHLYSTDGEDGKNQWRLSFTQWVHEHALPSDNIRVLLAETEKSVIGCAIGIIDLRAPTSACKNGISGWVQSVITAPEFRGKGVARKIMVDLVNWFSAKDCACIVLEATPISERLYRNLGFVSNGESLMTKVLGGKL